MIYYCQVESQITFYINSVLVQEISEWNVSISRMLRPLASLAAARNPSASYILRLTLLPNNIAIEVERDTVGRITIDRFEKVVNVRRPDETALMDTALIDEMVHAIGFRNALTDSKRLGCIFMFTPQDYKDVRDWKLWIDSEALSGRYQYEFFYNNIQVSDVYGAVIDTQSGQKALLDPWADACDEPFGS